MRLRRTMLRMPIQILPNAITIRHAYPVAVESRAAGFDPRFFFATFNPLAPAHDRELRATWMIVG